MSREIGATNRPLLLVTQTLTRSGRGDRMPLRDMDLENSGLIRELYTAPDHLPGGGRRPRSDGPLKPWIRGQPVSGGPQDSAGRTRDRRREPACKPGSVVDSHTSGVCVTAHLARPTRERRGPRHRPPIWSCSGWGLPCHRCCHRRGAPLPHHFTLTGTSNEVLRRYIFCGTFRRLTPPRRYLAPCPVEPGLSSAPVRDTAAVRPTPAR